MDQKSKEEHSITYLDTSVSSSDILFIDSALTSDVFEVGMMSSRLLRSATDTIREDSRTC